MLIRRRQATRQVGLVVQILQTRAFIPMRRVSGMAKCAVDVEQPPAARLLRAQSQLGIGHFRPVLLAAGLEAQRRENDQGQKDGRCSPQMTIMS